jgi:hypothetical protein
LAAAASSPRRRRPVSTRSPAPLGRLVRLKWASERSIARARYLDTPFTPRAATEHERVYPGGSSTSRLQNRACTEDGSKSKERTRAIDHGARSQLCAGFTAPQRDKQPVKHAARDRLALAYKLDDCPDVPPELDDRPDVPPELHNRLATSFADIPHVSATAAACVAWRRDTDFSTAGPCLPPTESRWGAYTRVKRGLVGHAYASSAPNNSRRDAPRTRKRARGSR